MQISPLGKTVLGVYFIVVGLLTIIFHKQLKQMTDDWHERLPSVFWRGPTGTLLTVTLIVLGSMSILFGVALLLVAFVQH